MSNGFVEEQQRQLGGSHRLIIDRNAGVTLQPHVMRPERYTCAAGLIALTGSLLLMVVLAWTPGISFSEDLGRHLLLGKIITESWSIPDTNFLTYTHPDHPFVNHHWLSEVALYHLHRVFGYNGLIVFKILVMTGALALSMLAGGRVRQPLWWWLAGILAAVMLGFRAHIRPELFTFLGVAWLLFCFERIRQGKRWPWAVTAVSLCLWANAHIYFIFGLGMCGAFALERGAARWKSMPDQTGWRILFGMWREGLWLTVLVGACALHPGGWSGLLYPLFIFSDYAVGITENISVWKLWHRVVTPAMLVLPPATALAAWAAWAHRKERPATTIILLTATIAAWSMARSMPLLALTLPAAVATLPVSARWLPGIISRPFRALVGGGMAVLNVVLIAAVVTGAWHRPFPSPVGPTPFGFDDERAFLALRDLQQAGLPGEIFTDYNVGSLAEYNLWPGLRGYVDNRPEAFPGGFWRTEYLIALTLGPEWEEIRARRNIRTIIVSLHGVKNAYTLELMRRPEWVLVHLDSLLGVWVYDEASTRPFLEQAAFTMERLEAFDRTLGERIRNLGDRPVWRRHVEADRAVYACYALLCIGEVERAWRHIWALHQRYPDYQIVHELMRVTAPPERVPEVMAVMAQRARWPLAAKQVLDWGRVLEAQGQWHEARDLYRRGRFFFPGSTELKDAHLHASDTLYANP